MLNIMVTKYVSLLESTKTSITDIIPLSHIGPFALTEGLLPLLKSTAPEQGADVRIVNVRSPHTRSYMSLNYADFRYHPSRTTGCTQSLS